MPLASHLAIDALVRCVCVGQTAAGLRCDGEVVFSVSTNTAHGIKEPAADRTLGIMVQRTCASTLGVKRSFPAFPNGGSTQFGHGQPAGNLLIFQKLVSGFNIDFGQFVQNHGCGQKACTQPPMIIFQSLDQPLFRKRCLLRCQQIQCQGANQLRLPVGIQGIVLGGDQLLIGALAALVILGK